MPSPPPSRPPRVALRRQGRHGALASALAGRVLAAAPVWIPALLALQISIYGLLPTWSASRHLARSEASVWSRVRALRVERAELERSLERIVDPLYRERVRRSLRVPGGEPLTLERAARQERTAPGPLPAASAGASATNGGS